MAAVLEEKLTVIFRRARHHGMAISLLPHLDAIGEHADWRNLIDFDPRAEYGGGSYFTHLLVPAAAALEAAAGENHAELTLAGEMGRTIYEHPAAWLACLTDLRARPGLKHTALGISLNHELLGGGATLDAPRRAALQQFLDACDFLGISAYQPVSVPPVPADFTRTIDHYMAELTRDGLHWPEGRALHFSEVGLGGNGRRADGSEAGLDATPAEIARSPYMGFADKTKSPWQDIPRRTLRREFHTALLDFLRTQPARWPVSGAWLWSMGSWCPYGYECDDSAVNRDEEIIKAIQAATKSSE